MFISLKNTKAISKIKCLKYFTLLLAIFYLNVNICFGYGKDGHEMVAKIAKSYTSKHAVRIINKLLGGTSWEKASTWMDEMRSDKSFDYMKPWHYINIEKDKTYVKTSDQNIINELFIVEGRLIDRNKYPKEEISIDIKKLFHMMGDLHQPLHVGYGVDKGGNTVKVDFNGKSTNLHGLWDYGLIESAKDFKGDIAAMQKKLTDEDIKKIQQGDFVSWMNDGRVYLPQIYDIQNNTISDAYVSKNIPVLENQILYAGIRLAGLLNKFFK